MTVRKIPLHIWILGGMLAGLLVGIVINLAWTSATWRSLGVTDAKAFLAGKQREVRLPEGVKTLSALIPGEERLRHITPAELDDELIEELALEQRGLVVTRYNEDAGFVAHSARFVRNANNFAGQLFMRMLRFIAVPIVLFSLIVGASSLGDLKKLGRIGGWTFLLYLSTTAIAITIGLILANVVRPGVGLDPEQQQALLGEFGEQAARNVAAAEGRPSPWQVLLNIVPTNPFDALAKGEMLQVVCLSLLVGVALTFLPKSKSEPVVRFCDGMTDVVIRIVHFAMLLAPIAVFALIVTVVVDLGTGTVLLLGKYGLTVVLGLAIHMFVVYPALFKAFTNMRYARFFKAISPAQLLAFSSSSSGATLPVTMECVEKRLGVREDVTSFVIPLGATINMDGTAMYQGVAAVFIAQLYGLDLSITEQLTIVLTATLASIGTAAVPSAGIVMLVIVLQAVGIPLEGIAMILGIDRILDMCRTAVNVTGDCAVATIVGAREGALLTEDQVRSAQEAESREEAGA